MDSQAIEIVETTTKNSKLDTLKADHKAASKEETADKNEFPAKWLNSIQCIDCVEGMKKLPANCIDMVVTSPPYDGIREYNGFSYNLHNAGEEIYRVLKDGGIAVMVN